LEELAKTNVSAEKDLHKIREQLVEMARDGHYLFHHIHPHWLDAVYIKELNQWDLTDIKRYGFGSLTLSDREKLFKYSYKFLIDILEQCNSINKPNGFRAGGLIIQPFNLFKCYFLKYGIKYNFDVVPGEKVLSDKLSYDFTGCPQDSFYRFDDNECIKSHNGMFTEYTITMFKLSGLYKILNGLYYRLLKKRNKIMGDGISANLGYLNNATKNYFVSWNVASIELMNPVMTRFFLILTQKKDYIQYLSHPKLLSYRNVIELNKYLKKINKQYAVEFDFKKFDIQ